MVTNHLSGMIIQALAWLLHRGGAGSIQIEVEEFPIPKNH